MLGFAAHHNKTSGCHELHYAIGLPLYYFGLCLGHHIKGPYSLEGGGWHTKGMGERSSHLFILI